MTADLTPEELAELGRMLEGIGYDGSEPLREWMMGHVAGRTHSRLVDAAVNLLPALLDAASERDTLAAERDRLREIIRSYGRTIDIWGRLIIAATHSEDITTPDGDGDWQVIEERLAEVPALLAERDALADRIERVRAIHWPQPYADADLRAVSPSLPKQVCAHCRSTGDGAVPWPCPTIRALDGAES